jgi:hypothetical protein
MKIRIKGNSIRYRLTMSEVEAFSSTGSVSESTSFGKNKFHYSLVADPDIAALGAKFENNTITLMLPEKHAGTWAESSAIGFTNTLKLEGGELLTLLLEKDFTCLDETEEDQSDNYPNPRTQS